MRNNYSQKEVLAAKAKEDLAAAKNLLKVEGFSEEIVLFHCQQAIEKALKAFLDYKKIIYPKSHDLETLLSICVEKEDSFNRISYVTALTQYAVEIRYDEIVELSEKEVSSLVKQTEEAMNFILDKIL